MRGSPSRQSRRTHPIRGRSLRPIGRRSPGRPDRGGPSSTRTSSRAPPEPEEPAVSRETSAPNASLPAPASTRVFVVANQKGGVGKTTSSVNLAAALALGGLSVLVIDLDPQGNASTALGVDHPPGTPGTYDVLIGGDSIAEHVVDSPEAPRLKVLPATIDLAGAEIELVSVVARENRLLRSLDRVPQGRSRSTMCSSTVPRRWAC